MTELTSFRLRECVGVERAHECLTQGLPLAQGLLHDPLAVALLDAEGKRLPLCAAALSHWPDGSVKWLRVSFPATVPALGTATYSLAAAEPAEEPTCGEVQATHEILSCDNGTLMASVLISSDNIAADLRRSDGSLETLGIHAVIMGDDGREYRSIVQNIEVGETSGRMILLARGLHETPAGTAQLFFNAWLTLHPGCDYLDLDYQLVHADAPRPAGPSPLRGRNLGDFEIPLGMRDERRSLRVRTVRLVIEHGLKGPLQYGTGSFEPGSAEENQFVYDCPFETRITEGPRTQYRDFEINSPLTDLVNQALPGACHGFVDVSDGRRGVAVSVRDYGQNWPKGMEARPDQIVVDIVPERADPLVLAQGQAKTTSVRIWLHDGDMRSAQIYRKHLAFNWPLHVDSPDTFLRSGALPKLMPLKPESYPLLEARFFREMDQMLLLQAALGMMDWGDHLRVSNATWGRPEAWSNNEQDLGWALFLQYARSGDRRFLRRALTTWQHWMDVDTCHWSEYEPEIGGWRVPGPRHVQYPNGKPSSASTAHVWAEGPIHLWLLTCHPAALETVRLLGDWLCRVCDAPEEAEYAQALSGDLERGWPLLALSALYEQFGEANYLKAATRVAESFLQGPAALQADGSLQQGYATLQLPSSRTALKVIALGLGRFHKATGDERFRELFLQVCRRIISPEAGGLVWELTGSDQSGFHMMLSGGWREVLGYAYELTGDRALIEAGMRGIQRAMPSSRNLGGISPAVVVEGGGVLVAEADLIAAAWRDLLPFMPYADELKLLKDF